MDRRALFRPIGSWGSGHGDVPASKPSPARSAMLAQASGPFPGKEGEEGVLLWPPRPAGPYKAFRLDRHWAQTGNLPFSRCLENELSVYSGGFQTHLELSAPLLVLLTVSQNGTKSKMAAPRPPAVSMHPRWWRPDLARVSPSNYTFFFDHRPAEGNRACRLTKNPHLSVSYHQFLLGGGLGLNLYLAFSARLPLHMEAQPSGSVSIKDLCGLAWQIHCLHVNLRGTLSFLSLSLSLPPPEKNFTVE